MLPGFTANLGAYLRPVYITLASNPAPTVGNTYFSISSSASVGNINSVVVPIGGVVLVYSGSEPSSATSPSVSSISGLGLVWTRRARTSVINQASGQNWLELWYAINNTGVSVSGTIALAYTTTYDDQASIAVVVNGCNLTNPFSSIAAATSTGLSSIPSITLSTDRANSLGIVIMGTSYPTNLSVPGWTLTQNAQNGGAVYWEYVFSHHLTFSTQQTNLSIAANAAPTSWCMIADSLVG